MTGWKIGVLFILNQQDRWQRSNERRWHAFQASVCSVWYKCSLNVSLGIDNSYWFHSTLSVMASGVQNVQSPCGVVEGMAELWWTLKTRNWHGIGTHQMPWWKVWVYSVYPYCGNIPMLTSHVFFWVQQFPIPLLAARKHSLNVTCVWPNSGQTHAILFVVVPLIQWPFQEPKLEVLTIYKASIKPM